jgi:uncharacterized protein involved in type VI secretion and phage assembly
MRSADTVPEFFPLHPVEDLRPSRARPKPVVKARTAVAVGPSGEETYGQIRQ